MPASQRLLFPDPRPLVERLGLDFFRQLPGCPGVYLMKDAAQGVLYVGKAKNLRQRLAGLAPLSGLALRGRIHGMGDRQDAPNRVAGVWPGGTAVALC